MNTLENRALKIKAFCESILGDKMGPLPEISRLFWGYMLAFQELSGIRGNLAGIGVEIGSTAFSMISSAKNNSDYVCFFDIHENNIFKKSVSELNLIREIFIN